MDSNKPRMPGLISLILLSVIYVFTNSTSEPSLFIFNKTSHVLLVWVCVDDIMIIKDEHFLIFQLIHEPKDKFFMKDIGLFSYFLSFEEA